MKKKKKLLMSRTYVQDNINVNLNVVYVIIHKTINKNYNLMDLIMPTHYF